jgi:hypothetical protein
LEGRNGSAIGVGLAEVVGVGVRVAVAGVVALAVGVAVRVLVGEGATKTVVGTVVGTAVAVTVEVAIAVGVGEVALAGMRRMSCAVITSPPLSVAEYVEEAVPAAGAPVSPKASPKPSFDEGVLES